MCRRRRRRMGRDFFAVVRAKESALFVYIYALVCWLALHNSLILTAFTRQPNGVESSTADVLAALSAERNSSSFRMFVSAFEIAQNTRTDAPNACLLAIRRATLSSRWSIRRSDPSDVSNRRETFVSAVLVFVFGLSTVAVVPCATTICWNIFWFAQLHGVGVAFMCAFLQFSLTLSAASLVSLTTRFSNKQLKVN